MCQDNYHDDDIDDNASLYHYYILKLLLVFPKEFLKIYIYYKIVHKVQVEGKKI